MDWFKQRYTPLLVALVLLFLCYPLAIGLDAVRFYRFLMVLVLIMAVRSMAGRRKARWKRSPRSLPTICVGWSRNGSPAIN